jgi:hypothetical protein
VLYVACVLLTQLAARFIELATAWPSPIAAIAIAAPIMARMRAYSAAEAPDSSFHKRMNVFISNFPFRIDITHSFFRTAAEGKRWNSHPPGTPQEARKRLGSTV